RSTGSPWKVQASSTVNGPSPKAAAPGPSTTFATDSAPRWKVLVTSTTAAGSSAPPTVTVSGSTVVAVAPPSSVSVTEHSAPTGRSVQAPVKPSSADRTRTASSPRSIGSPWKVHANSTVNGPAPKASAPAPSRVFSTVTWPTSKVLVTSNPAGAAA